MGSQIEFGHPLHGAELRLARARQLIGTMHRQYQRYADTHERSGWIGRVDETTKHLRLSPRLSNERHVHVPRVSITLGEVAYNVRSALDFLVYSIARASNDCIEVRGTQFPLESTPHRYWARWTGKDTKTGKRVPRMLNKIPHDVAKDLAHYQPFAKCVWAELLSEISNPDKHRHLTTLGTSAEFIPDRPVLSVIDTKSGGQTIHLKGKVQISVSLEFRGDTIDVIKASNLVQREATALIRSYAGRFQLPGPRFV
jgi:hypothetical protein